MRRLSADPLERAKLDFSFGNALRQHDPNDIPALREAERRIMAAGEVFQAREPRYRGQVNEALDSVRNLLSLAPLAAEVDQARVDMDALHERMDAGEDPAPLATDIMEVMERGGGVPGIFTQLQRVIDGLPKTANDSPQFEVLGGKMSELAALIAGKQGPANEQDAEIMKLLQERLEKDAGAGLADADRLENLSSMITEFGHLLGSDSDDVGALMGMVDGMQDKMKGFLETTHYLSHGIPRPADGSRAAQLVELCWMLRQGVLREAMSRGKTPGESKAVTDFSIRLTELDKKIYERGEDDARASALEREAFRPLALEVRQFFARHHPMLVNPIWSSAKLGTDPNSVYFAGSDSMRARVAASCVSLTLDLLGAPRGEDVAESNWKQLNRANVAVFDLTTQDGPDRAAVAYDLGIARTLGTPVVVLALKGEPIPFDIEVPPVWLTGTGEDTEAITEALDLAQVWVMPRPKSSAVTETITAVLEACPIPHSNTYVDQTLKLLKRLRDDPGPLEEKPDPVAVSSALESLVNCLEDDHAILTHPVWPPKYREEPRARVFHVMPFGPDWADDVAASAENSCTSHGAEYIRGDRVEEANVIKAIWDEINVASHVLVDLTGFNANVALELGLAHALGRPTIMAGQGDTVERLFPSIAKLRFYPYEGANEIGKSVEALLG